MNEGLQAFIKEWSAREGREKGEAQSFWRSLLGDVLGVAHPDYELDFELKVKIGGGWVMSVILAIAGACLIIFLFRLIFGRK